MATGSRASGLALERVHGQFSPNFEPGKKRQIPPGLTHTRGSNGFQHHGEGGEGKGV